MFSLVPFLLQYTKRLDPSKIEIANNDVLHQLDLLWEHCYDTGSGLLVHGYDASRTAVWANLATGGSPHVWGRALGWYVMALLNALEEMEIRNNMNEQQRLQERFENLMREVAARVDPVSGCWWQMIAHPGKTGNFLESSCSAMFVYSMLKGVRLGYLQDSPVMDPQNEKETRYTLMASKAYNAIIDRFVIRNADGTLSYDGTVAVCSLNSPASYHVSSPAGQSYNRPCLI